MDHTPEIFLEQVKAIETRLAGLDLADTVLLTGSSIMEQWETAAADLLPLRTLNIGIGGTRLGDHLFYFERLLGGRNPRAIVIYAGSNDLNGGEGDSKSGRETAALAREYLELVRARFPDTPLFYISIIEAPCKAHIFAEIRAANGQIAAFCAGQPGMQFIDCGPAMLDPHGAPDESLYVEDRLHLTAQGYQRWRSAIWPVLQKIIK